MRGKAIRAANAFVGLPALVAGKRDKQGVLLVRAAAAERFTLFPRRGNRAAARCAPRGIVCSGATPLSAAGKSRHDDETFHADASDGSAVRTAKEGSKMPVFDPFPIPRFPRGPTIACFWALFLSTNVIENPPH